MISNTLFNKHTGLAIVCPITSTFRNFPFHIEVSADSGLTGFIMDEQIKSVDFASRKTKFVKQAPQATLDEVLSILDACICGVD